MAAKRRYTDGERINLQCSREQKSQLVEAAQRAGCDLTTLILSHALAGAARTAGAAPGDTPVIINGAVGTKLRARAAEQGVPPERMLEMLLIAMGG